MRATTLNSIKPAMNSSYRQPQLETLTGLLLPGRRAGKLSSDSEVKRTGKTSVRLVPDGDWFALASVNYPVPPWADRLELSGWARTEDSASAQILACWTDDAQQVLRVDASKAISGPEWMRVSLTPSSPPDAPPGITRRR